MKTHKRWMVPILLSAILILTSCILDSGRTVQLYASATTSLDIVGYFSSADYINNWVISPSSPWSVEIQDKKGNYIYLTISGDGDLIARIYVDGVLWKEKTGTIILQLGGYLE